MIFLYNTTYLLVPLLQQVPVGLVCLEFLENPLLLLDQLFQENQVGLSLQAFLLVHRSRDILEDLELHPVLDVQEVLVGQDDLLVLKI